jgi:hypothetical protein
MMCVDSSDYSAIHRRRKVIQINESPPEKDKLTNYIPFIRARRAKRGEEINKAEVISKLFKFSIFFLLFTRAESMRM